MFSHNGRMTDLFIPVGRPHSSASTTQTDVTVDTVPVSALSKSTTTSPATTISSNISSNISSKLSAHRAITRESAKPSSPSSTRYTISGPSPDACSQNNGSVSPNPQPRVDRPNTVHIRRHSQRTNDPPTSVTELSHRLSRVTGSVANRNAHHAPPNTVRQLTSPINNPISSKAVATPRTPLSPNRDGVMLENSSLARSNTMDLGDFQRMSSTEAYAPEMAPTSLPRSPSQNSNLSNRSCPPVSFPSKYSDPSSGHPPIFQSPHRAMISKELKAPNATRSTSPLKFEISGRGDVHGTLATVRRPIHRRHQSDSTTLLRHRRKASLTSGTTYQAPSSFHSTIHFYTSCPHTSPPCSRPLDISPQLDESCQPPRSRIPGSCFDCDTIERRETEAMILASFNSRISLHLSDLDAIEARMESTIPSTPISSTQNTRLNYDLDYISFKATTETGHEERNPHSSHSSLMSEEAEGIPILVRMEVLQERITELTIQRDKEVKELWRGYSQRWGPGTIGLLKEEQPTIGSPGTPGGRSIIGTPGTPGSRFSTRSGRSNYAPSEGRMDVDWIRKTKHHSDSTFQEFGHSEHD